MKLNKTLPLLFAVLAFTFVSCNKDNSAAKPTVTLTEVGHDNEKHAMQGDDLHLEADIVAEGLIKRIDVELHQESGTFEIEESFTDGKYIGVKNTTFHEHIEIPETAPLGEYHLHFTVTDQQGQTVMTEAHVQIIEYDENHQHDE